MKVFARTKRDKENKNGLHTLHIIKVLLFAKEKRQAWGKVSLVSSSTASRSSLVISQTSGSRDHHHADGHSCKHGKSNYQIGYKRTDTFINTYVCMYVVSGRLFVTGKRNHIQSYINHAMVFFVPIKI